MMTLKQELNLAREIAFSNLAEAFYRNKPDKISLLRKYEYAARQFEVLTNITTIGQARRDAYELMRTRAYYHVILGNKVLEIPYSYMSKYYRIAIAYENNCSK